MNSENKEKQEYNRIERTLISGSKVKTRTSAKNTKRRATLSGLEVDFDRLVSNIEKSIMADKNRGTVGITPQQLLLKSNPAMYAFERETEMSRDLTNPRDMYNLLSHNTKSTEDLTAKFKQEIARNIQAPGVFPKLSRSNTLHEIGRLHHRKSDKLDRFQSASEILTPNKKLNVLVVTRNKSNLEGFRTIIEDDKENLHALNLPNITQIVSTKVDTGIASDKNKRIQFGFPVLSAEQNAQNRITTTANHVDNFKEPDSATQQLNTANLRSRDTKIDKWFSEMPNEVFDKAQRAIMEGSIKDKLTKYQHKRNRKENFPAHVNVMHGSRLRKVPNTFLEVRVDSFGKYLKHEERMNKYKLQQKSILKLKMKGMDEMERHDKAREDIDYSPGLRMQYRSNTTMTYKNKNNSTPEMHNKEVDVKKVDKGLKTFNVNEVLKRDIMSRERTHINNYQEYTEKRHMSKSAQDRGYLHDCGESERDTVPKICSPVSKGSESAGIINKNASGSDRGIAKTSVVTIALGKDDSAKIQKQSNNQNVLNNTGVTHKTYDEGKNGNKQKDSGKTNEDKIEEKDTEREEETEENGETSKCVTKIPTAKSSRTTDSNRSTISSKQSPKPNKSVLSRFNKLEVFAEHGKASDAKMIRNSYHGHKLRDHESKETTVPPSYKLDLKNYPQHFKNPIPDEHFVINNEVRKQEVVFRFEPGEVYITRKSNPNRASERARIIYGKVFNKDDKALSTIKDAKHVKDSHSAHSLSTGLDGYKFEVGNFEHRALADSVPSDSVREHGHPNTRISNPVEEESEYVNRPDLETASTITKTPQEFYMRYGKVVRDIAIETDILGSETDSLRGHFVEDRPESNLSDYIIDNNDGESLNSDSETDDHFQLNPVRKSTVKSRGTQSRVSAKTFQST